MAIRARQGKGLSGAAANVAGSSDKALIALPGIGRSGLERSLGSELTDTRRRPQGKIGAIPAALRGSPCMHADDDVGVP